MEGDVDKAFHLITNRMLWDNTALRYLDAPLFASGDTLLVFDFFNSVIHMYSPYGILLKERPILFRFGDLMLLKMIHDEVTDRYFVLDRRTDMTSITEIDVEHGVATANSFKLEKSFTDKVRIRGDNIYYLFQNGRGSVKQLYIQRNTVK